MEPTRARATKIQLLMIVQHRLDVGAQRDHGYLRLEEICGGVAWDGGSGKGTRPVKTPPLEREGE
jgi:hypothetical protein